MDVFGYSRDNGELQKFVNEACDELSAAVKKLPDHLAKLDLSENRIMIAANKDDIWVSPDES